MDIPGCLSSLFLIDKIGRKTVMIGATLIGGVACIACMFTIVYGGQGKSLITFFSTFEDMLQCNRNINELFEGLVFINRSIFTLVDLETNMSRLMTKQTK